MEQLMTDDHLSYTGPMGLYGSSAERSSQLAGWIDSYNYRQSTAPSAIACLLFASTSSGNKLLGNYS
jgi:hypothetical protein